MGYGHIVDVQLAWQKPNDHSEEKQARAGESVDAHTFITLTINLLRRNFVT
jgi:hypothetical protein